MPRGRQLALLILDEETGEQLLGLSKSTTLPHSVVLRAKMILASGECLTNTGAGLRVGASPQAVGKWRRRFLQSGLSGLHDEFRPGRPRTYGDDKAAALARAVRGQAASDENVQGVQRPVFRREGAGHRRTVPESARARGRAVRRREVPGAGTCFGRTIPRSPRGLDSRAPSGQQARDRSLPECSEGKPAIRDLHS